MPSTTFRRAAAAVVTTATACALAIAPMTAASAAIVPDPVSYSAESAALELTPIGTFETGVFDESAAEIVHAHGDRLYVVNALAGSVTVLDYSDPTQPRQLVTIDAPGVANSVAIREDGLGVIAFEDDVKTNPGRLVFFDADAAAPTILGQVTVGALPDMVTISEDGAYAVVANEGEPDDDFAVDPEGSVGVVALPSGKAAPSQGAVRIADFHAFEGANLPAGVRVFGPTPEAGFPVSRNLEPEYIALDGGTAYAALQEANAIAVVDLATATVTDLLPLGYKDHGLPGNGLDASDRDGGISIATYPGLRGLYMPDGLNSYSAGGETYLVSANEGDAREWGEFADGARAGTLDVCDASPLAGAMSAAQLGRLNVVTDLGRTDAGCYENLYSYGGRSFSIWSTDGEQVFDSGDDFEQITAAAVPANFNSTHAESNFDNRSDDKGPEPENLAIGEVDGRTYAFIGLERVGGVMVYDITDPESSAFVTYVNNRDFSVSGEDDLATAGDLGAEGLEFIAAEDSPNGRPMLAVANEVSGTTTLFHLDWTPDVTEVSVLTINDFHGRIEADGDSAGAAVLAGAIDRFESENPNTIFASAGDNIGASTFTSFIQQDEPTIDALVAAGLDVSAVGNHEFDRGYADLTERVLPRYGSEDFGLGANVYFEDTGEPALQEYAIQEVDGVRVAFIGTVTPDTAAMVTPTGIEGLVFGDQLEAANRVATELTAGDLADVIVLLAHDGSATNQCASIATEDSDYGDLVRGASPAIDAIVSGHTHQSYACEIAIGGVAGTERPVIQALEYGKTLGKLDIAVNSTTKALVSIEGSLVPLTEKGVARFPADPTVQAIVDDAVAVAEEEGQVEVGRISADILRGGTPPGSDRGVESSLGNLVADVYLWATSNENYGGAPAQIGLMNPGGLRADLLYGPDGVVTYQEAADVQPFANTLVTVTLTGAQLKQVLEEQWQPAGSSRPKLHLGVSQGFAYEYDQDAARGEHILSMTLDGQAIAADDTFTVVTNSFLAAGGDNFGTFAKGTDRTDTGQVDLQATVDYFAAFDVVDPAELGRAIVADGDTASPTPGTGQPGTGTGAGGTGGSGAGTGTAGSGADRDSLAFTGGELPIGLALAAALAVMLGGGIVVARRRRAGATTEVTSD